MVIAEMLAGSKPGSTAIRWRRERTRSPAPTKSTMASDICAITSAPRRRAAGTPAVVRVVAACRSWIPASERLNAEDNKDCPPRAADHLLHQQHHRRAPPGVKVGIVRLELTRDARHFGLGALDRDAVLEPAERHGVAARAGAVRPVERHRLPVLLVAERHRSE